MKFRKIKYFFILVLLGLAAYRIVSLFQEAFGVAEELPAYTIPPKHHDDTLRVAIIGDSWAHNHAEYQCDTLFEYYAKKITSRPVKCVSKGHNGQKTKGVYMDMFANRPVKYEWERDYCTQPLLEEHPDYCIVMAGINDLARQVPPITYAENYRQILQLLISNGIRPVVMEIPDFDVTAACRMLGNYKYFCYRIVSIFTKAGWDTANYREALQSMLRVTGLIEQVVYVAADTWNPGGVYKQPYLYQSDRSHLNQQGYHVLDLSLVKVLWDKVTRSMEMKCSLSEYCCSI